MKDRKPTTINLTPKTEEFLKKRQDALGVSQSTYINDLLIFAMRARKQIKQCPESYLAINVDDSEVAPLVTHVI
jgi:hypothetical protein